jgi:hypothetical protein
MATSFPGFASHTMPATEPSPMDQILSSLRLGHLVAATTASNVNIVVTSEDIPTTPTANTPISYQQSDAELLAKLQYQQARLSAQQQELAGKDASYRRTNTPIHNTTIPSTSYTSSTDLIVSGPATGEPHPGASASATALFEQQEQRISALQSQLAQREQLLAMTQNQAVARPTLSTVTASSPTEDSFHSSSISDHNGARRSSAFNANAPPFMSRHTFAPPPMSPSAMSDTHSVANSEYNALNRPMCAPSSYNNMRVMSGPAPSTFNEQFPDPVQQQMQQFMAWQAQIQGLQAPQGMPGMALQSTSGMAPTPFFRQNSTNRRGGFGRRATNIPTYGSYGYGNGNGSAFNQPMSYQVGMYSPTSSSFPSRPGTSMSSISGDNTEYGGSGLSLSSLTSLVCAILFTHRQC